MNELVFRVEIDTSGKPELVAAEVLRCLRERFPDVRVLDAANTPVVHANPWKGE